MHQPAHDWNALLASFGEALSSVEIQTAFRQSAQGDWDIASEKMAYLPVNYSTKMMEYQQCYWNGIGQPTQDLSVILYHEKHPIALWPLSLSRSAADELRVSSNGGAELHPPLFVADLAAKTIKTLTSKCFAALNQFCADNRIAGWQSASPFSEETGLSAWHDKAMQAGGRASLKHELFLEVTRPIEEIKSGFRKSYKALVNSGAKWWSTHLLIQADPAIWEDFRTLHQSVAGRSTRSRDSWSAQLDAIACGAAFFVFLRDGADKMVGGSLFYVTRDECVYAVGAYDRSLFDKPLGHVVQYRAIEEMKRRNIRWYKLGQRSYPGDVPEPSSKELSISDFKQGFASHLFPIHEIRYEPKES
jgi:FemAB family protein